MESVCPSCSTQAEREVAVSGLLVCENCGTRYLPPGTHYAILSIQGDSEPGERIELPPELTGRWTLDIVLGAGAMGVVYSAQANDGSGRVAIKFLTKVDSADLRKRFTREAKMMGRIQHDNVVRIFEAGEAKGYPFLVMELVDGMSLRDRLEREGAMECAEAVKFTLQLLDGLAYCHAKGVIHRDIKPENTLITKSDQVKLSDLGIALDTAEKQTRMTATGNLVGTPAYMAPEVLQGEDATYTSDIYSVAVTLYELLTGNQPYAARSFYDLVSLHYTTRPVPPCEAIDGVPVVLSDLVMAGLSRTPAERPATAEEMADALRAMQAEIQKSPPRRLSAAASATATATMGAANQRLQLGDPTGQSPSPRRSLFVPALAALALIGGGAYALRPRLAATTAASPLPVASVATSGSTSKNPQYIEGKRYYDAQQYDKSFPLFQEAAAAGDRDAMFRLGASYTKARGTASDPVKGAEWYLKAAELGHVDAQVSIATAFSRGAGVARDPAAAFKWMLKAADQADVPAMAVVGQSLMRGEGVTKDPIKGLDWLRRAAKHDFPEACGQLGYHYLNGIDVEKDEEEAIRWLSKAAESQLPEALYSLAICHAKGRGGMPVNLAEAHKYLNKAAEQAYAPAYTMLGDLSLRGDGVPQSEAKAAEYYAKSAELGDPGGMRELGQALRDGRGIPRDAARAVDLLDRASKAGDLTATECLGLMLMMGDGVPADEPRARKLLEQAQANGSSNAETVLAIAIDSGKLGFNADPEKAFKMFKRAAEAGSAEACSQLASRYDARKQPAESRRWLIRAAELGNVNAMMALGDELDAENKRDEAIGWYRKAAKEGLVFAKKRLEKMGASADASPVTTGKK